MLMDGATQSPASHYSMHLSISSTSTSTSTSTCTCSSLSHASLHHLFPPPPLSLAAPAPPPHFPLKARASFAAAPPQIYHPTPIMGFPVGYSEMPRLVLHLLFLLAHLRRLSSWLLRLTGADLDYPAADLDLLHHHHHHHYHYHYGDSDTSCGFAEGGAGQLEKHSPAVRFDALSAGADDGGRPLPEGCAVCLGDFHGAAQVRRPRGCRHVFHRACLDRWAAHGQRTCPLCRAPLVPTPASPMLLPLPLPAS